MGKPVRTMKHGVDDKQSKSAIVAISRVFRIQLVSSKNAVVVVDNVLTKQKSGRRSTMSMMKIETKVQKDGLRLHL